MNKKTQMQFNLNGFLLSLSTVLDIAQENRYGLSQNHSKKVAFLSLKLGEKLNLTQEEMSDLCSYALTQGLGVNNDNKNREKFPFLDKYKNILQCQNEEIPLLAQIVSFSHFLDEKFNLASRDIENREKIISFLNTKRGVLFSAKIVDIFLEISSNLDFWLDIQNENDILYYIFSTLNDYTMVLNFEDILKFTKTFLDIVDGDTKFLDMCEKMCDFYNFEHKEKQTFLIAASLSKIGKLAIPDEIIHKNKALSKNEYEVIKSYPYYTKKVLNNIIGFSDITNWACRIQERLDGSGYPFKLSGKDLSLKDRLMAILSVYHALLTKKTYRDAYGKEEIFQILRKEAEQSKLDKAIVEDLIEVFNI